MKSRIRSTYRTRPTLGIRGALLSGCLVVAVLIAGIGIGKKQSAKAAQHKPEQSESELMLPVPLHQVASGTSFADVEIAYVRWPRDRHSTQYVTDIGPLRDHVTQERLLPYAPIPLHSVVAAAIESNAVVQRIPEGMRAITVRVDTESAVEGWAQSGSSVDVMVMRQLADGDNRYETKVIAENVKVLSAGRSAKAHPDAPQPPATVTLLVDQTNALRVKTAANLGKLTFSLRGVGDSEPTTLTHMNQRALLGTPRLSMPSESAFRGSATAPDGSRWVLSEGNRWMRQDSLSVEKN